MHGARILRGLVLLLLVAAVVWGLSQREQFSVEGLQQQLAVLGGWAPMAFVAAYALATVLFLPGVLFTLTGGVLFGPWWGAFYSLLGATAGATLAFLAARHLAGGWVRAHAGQRLGRLMDGVEREGWRFVAFARLVPVFPFNLLNYALGLTRIPLGPYLLASFVCMAPGALGYSWLGYAGAKAVGGGEGTVRAVLLALGALAALLFLPRLVRRWRGHRGTERD